MPCEVTERQKGLVNECAVATVRKRGPPQRDVILPGPNSSGSPSCWLGASAWTWGAEGQVSADTSLGRSSRESWVVTETPAHLDPFFPSAHTASRRAASDGPGPGFSRALGSSRATKGHTSLSLPSLLGGPSSFFCVPLLSSISGDSVSFSLSFQIGFLSFL